MTWESPKTWTSSQVGASEFNQHIRDNLNALKSPSGTDINDILTTSNYTTTSTSFANIDTTANTFEVTVTPDADGGSTWFRIWARISLRCNSTSTVKSANLDLTRDGTSLSGGTGMHTARGNSDQIYPVNFEHWDQVSGTAAVTYRLRWRVESNGTAQINVSSGGVSECRPQFGAREVS